MIRLLVRFGLWLDKRFPPKVTITLETWEALIRRLELLETRAKVAMEKLDAQQDSLIEVAKTVSSIGKQKEESKPAVSPKQAFIATGDVSLIK